MFTHLYLLLKLKRSRKCAYSYLVVSELCNNWLMQKKADVFEEIERPWCSRALVHLLLMLGFMRVDAFQDT